MELEERRTRRGDERGDPMVCPSFLWNPGATTLYLLEFQADNLVRV
jgi:hypothetical protein